MKQETFFSRRICGFDGGVFLSNVRFLIACQTSIRWGVAELVMCYSVGSVCILSIACLLSIACMIVSSVMCYSVGSVCILSIACMIVLSSPAVRVV